MIYAHPVDVMQTAQSSYYCYNVYELAFVPRNR